MSYIPYRDRRLSISEEVLGAFVKSQTYRYSSEDIHRIYKLFVSAEERNRAEYTTEGRKHNKSKLKSWKIGEIKYMQNITCWNCNQNGYFQNQCSKLVATRDKEVNITAEDSYDALVCCVKNT
ncbi:retrovirus-related pol polyprotein from transposon TNT 1-94, partial [Tanacetum coccineum]